MILLALLLCSSIDLVRSVAPGDEDVLCTREPQFSRSHPSNRRLLLDSYNYRSLFPNVWKKLDMDGEGQGWHTSSGTCRNVIQVCDFQNGPEQNNWLFTQYISYPSPYAREIFINIAYNFSECQNNPVCDIPYFNVLHFDTDIPNPQDQVKSRNYNLIQQIKQPATLINTTTATVCFQRQSNSTGLYLAVQDVGSCGDIMQIQVYYEQCPSMTVGLVLYPALPLPVRNSHIAANGTAVCAANARNLSRLEFRAFGDGECERSVICECLPGYVEEQQLISGTNTLVSQCKACAPGMYRSEFDPSCQLCPQNSESVSAASVECLCLDGYFRAPSEGAHSPCTAPPSSCTGTRVVLVTATDITVEWRRPDFTGREDFYYSVFYRELTNSSGTMLGPYINKSDYVDFAINGLQPSTQYLIKITVRNGVSDQDVKNDISRTCETVASTADIGQPRNVSGFCKVVTWRPPLSAGTGTPQLGYVVRLFIPGADGDIVIKKAAGELYHIQDSEKPSSMYFVQVRSTIGVINGPWSVAVPLGCDDDDDVQMVTDGVPVLTPVVHYAQDRFIIWNGTNTASDGSTYEIRYKQIGNKNFTNISTNRTLLAHALLNLETDARYTVEVRQVNGNRAGNWSLPFSFQTTGSTILSIIFHPKSSSVVAGDDIELACTARGSDPLLFVWGTTANITSAGLPPSVQSSNTDGSVTSALYLMNAGKEHVGEYLCIIMDSTGSRLLSQPADVSVLILDTGVQISFNQSSYMFNESQGFASFGIYGQGNISEPIFINVTTHAGFNGTSKTFPSLEKFNQIITLTNKNLSTVVITIPLIADMIALEDLEVVFLQMEVISPVPEYVQLIEPASAVIYVLDNSLVTVGFSVPTVSVLEGVGLVTVCIKKSADTIVPVTVSAELVPLTANFETDFMMSQSQLEIVFGTTERQKCFNVQLVDDSAQEVDEMFQLLITSTSPVDSRMQLDLTTITVTIIDDDIVSGLRFAVGGRTYPNNSVISLWNVGEDDEALSCITDYVQCCSNPPHRHGEFYYPSGERVGILAAGGGMYRNRGNQVIRLNRKNDVTSPTGRFRCDLPNVDGRIQSIYINLSQTIISFEQASYVFSEDIGVGRVCLERSGYVQEQNDIQVIGALQEGTMEILNEIVSFLPVDVGKRKCIEISVVDDDVALEAIEEWTLRLQATERRNYLLGDIQTAVIQVIDDDELTMSLVKIANVSESGGELDICVQFSGRFAKSFEIFLNASASPGSISSAAQGGVDYTLPTPVMVISEHSRNASACLNLSIIDDGFAEADECLVITVTATVTIAPVSGFFCITDNDGVQVSFQKPVYMFLENQGTVDVCVEKLGFIPETIQVVLFGALQQETGQTLNQILAFSPTDSIKCSEFMLVDDELCLEEIEFLTLSLRLMDLSPAQRFSLGQYNQTSIGILDDDELVLSLVNASNFSEGAGHAEVCFTFSLPFVSSFTFHLSTVVSPNITILHRATPDIDYAAIPLTLSPGIEDSRNESLCFKFAIFDDGIVEPDECIVISIESAPDTVRIAENGITTVLCIIDDDQEVVIGFSQRSYLVREDSGEVQLSVHVISGEIKRPSTLSISTVPVTAVDIDDYVMITGEDLQFGRGLSQLRNVTITIVNDSIVEMTELFSALLTTTTAGVTLAPNQSLIYILDNDVLIGFEHVNYSASETAGQLMINITVLDGILTYPISVAISTSDGTAFGNSDYVSVMASLQQLTPEDSSTVISIGIINDNITEGEEDFTIELSSASPEVGVSPSTAVITILDDDGQDMVVGFEHTSYTVEESAGMIQLTVDIAGRTTRPVSISYSTLNDTAIGGNDFQQRSETVMVSPPDTQVVISVQIFPDNLLEGEERFSVLIASSDQHVAITQSTAQITIVDNSEVNVEFGSSDYSIQESADHVEVCLTLDGMAVFPISFRISAGETSPRDAEDGVDFIAAANDVVLLPLTSEICTEFTVLNDNFAEAQMETFIVTFATATSDVQVGTNDRATVYITDSYSGDLYFMLNGQRIAYNSETAVNIGDIGTGENALLCFTDRPNCCSGSGRAGEWYYPDGRRVNIQGADEDFYRNRGSRVVRLNRARNVLAPTGRYRCHIPDATGTTQNIFISIIA